MNTILVKKNIFEGFGIWGECPGQHRGYDVTEFYSLNHPGRYVLREK